MDVAVVGSTNLDVVVTLARRPAPGETVLGDSYVEAAGGKGANQAMAAARVGTTAFVGCVGRDAAGEVLVRALHDAGARARVARVDVPTGRAFIHVTPDGENDIVVVPGANSALDAAAVTRALDDLRPSVVATQLEISADAVTAAARWCERAGARFVLNASPTRDLPPWLVALADPLVVNAGEAAAILGTDEDADPARLAEALLTRARSAVVTAGAGGAYVADDGDVRHVPAPPATARDTTGAGDAFAGTLAARLALGDHLVSGTSAAAAEASHVVALSRDERGHSS
ncbi:ribokinase [Cellulomonas sp. APG4]|uniref:ribokinase n=1 Tax=Cellulomonas sp. APG4 TaxID=1538656 RepID=UPI001379B51F|nr:ribokinase [Cellulomonas sp. APG4]